MRKYLPGLLLVATFLIAEAHAFYAHDERIINIGGVQLPIQWAVKGISDQINLVFIGLALFLLGLNTNKFTHAVTAGYLGWMVMDGIMYFYNHKTTGYFVVYIVVAFILIIAYRK